MLLDDTDVQYFLQVHEEIGQISGSDVAVSCPQCREGKSWGRKHRLHLYIKPSYDTASVHCWNCGYASNIYGYLKEFFPQEFSSYRKAKAGKGFAELRMSHEAEDTKKSNNLDLSTVDIGMDMTSEPFREPEKIPKAITKIEPLFNLDEFADGEAPVSNDDMKSIDIGFSMDFGSSPAKKEVPKPPSIIKSNNPDIPNLIEPPKNLIELPQEVKDYITNRGIVPQDDWLYSVKNNKIRFNESDVTLSEFIIVPLTIDGKWYGFQALAWKQKKFFVYLVTGNTSWKVWNWNKINKAEPVYIFESIYDALSSGLENSIGVLGANLHDDRIKQLKQPIFCLDNQNVDEKSIEESMKYLHEGHKVFLWPDGSDKFKDTNDLRKINVPYETISKMITNNIFQGMKGVLKLKFYS